MCPEVFGNVVHEAGPREENTRRSVKAFLNLSISSSVENVFGAAILAHHLRHRNLTSLIKTRPSKRFRRELFRLSENE